MGTWSIEPFGNDLAADWAWELDAASSWLPVDIALAGRISADGANPDSIEIMVAAAEAVAHGVGAPTQNDAYTKSVSDFVERVGAPPADTIARARRSLGALLGTQNDIGELWDEVGRLGDWHESLRAIDAALSGPADPADPQQS